MSNDHDKFFEILFDANEKTCFSKTPYGTYICSPDSRAVLDVYFTINPLSGNRCDANVTAYRNILIEMDRIPLDVQKDRLSDVPYSTLVYSGGKSYHAIISLQEPCSSRAEYDALVDRIYSKIPDADRSARNPSRFSRVPGAVRDNGKEQELLFVGSRISRAILEAWLGPAPVPKPRAEPVGVYNEFTNFFLRHGAEEGSWNISLFKAACDMTRNGAELADIIEDCTAITGRLDSRDLATIRSAHRSAKRDY